MKELTTQEREQRVLNLRRRARNVLSAHKAGMSIDDALKLETVQVVFIGVNGGGKSVRGGES